jgi:hypothetical protein
MLDSRRKRGEIEFEAKQQFLVKLAVCWDPSQKEETKRGRGGGVRRREGKEETKRGREGGVRKRKDKDVGLRRERRREIKQNRVMSQ